MNAQVSWIDNGGRGVSEVLQLDGAYTYGDIFRKMKPGANWDSFHIRVHGQPVRDQNQRAQPGDRISCTPAKIEGA